MRVKIFTRNVPIDTSTSGYPGVSLSTNIIKTVELSAGFRGYSGVPGFSGVSGFSGEVGFSGFSGWSGDSGVADSGFSGTSACRVCLALAVFRVLAVCLV
jgi:hypothetical protein